HRHVYGEQWIKFMKDGVNATPLPTVNTTGYIDHAAFLGTINPDTNKIPKHLFQGYLNIYNNYFKAPWMPRSEERRVGREWGSRRSASDETKKPKFQRSRRWPRTARLAAGPRAATRSSPVRTAPLPPSGWTHA